MNLTNVKGGRKHSVEKVIFYTIKEKKLVSILLVDEIHIYLGHEYQHSCQITRTNILVLKSWTVA